MVLQVVFLCPWCHQRTVVKVTFSNSYYYYCTDKRCNYHGQVLP